MENKQTAVEWLYHQIVIKNSDVLKFRQYLEQAKKMEKNQIVDAYNEGNAEWTAIIYTDAKHYYNETYNQ